MRFLIVWLWVPILCAATRESRAQTPVAGPIEREQEGAAAEQAQLVLDVQGFTSLVGGLTFSPDGKWIAAAGEKEVRIWDIETGELKTTLRGQRERSAQGNCYAVAFSPDGRELVVGIDDYSAHGSLRVYDVADFSQIKELVPGHGTPVRQLAFSRDGTYLASSGDNGNILLWQWKTRQRIATIPPPDPDQPVYDYLQFPTAEPYLVVGQASGPAVFAVPEGTRLGPQSDVPANLRAWLAGLGQLQMPLPGQAQRACLLLDRGVWLASGQGADAGKQRYWVGVWSAGNPAPQGAYTGHSYLITSLAIGPAGKLAASADAFGEIHVWDVATRRARVVLRGLGRPNYTVAFGHGGKKLYFGTQPNPAGRWDRNRFGEVRTCFDFSKRAITDETADPLPPLTLAQADRTLKLEWRDNHFQLSSLKAGQLEKRYKVRTGVSPMSYGFLRQPRLNLDSVVVLGDDHGGLVCYDPATREERREFVGHEAFVTGVSQSEDGRFLATSSTDRTLRIWSLENYQALGDVDFEYLADHVVEIRPGSHSQQAGIQVGDRFLALDGHTLTDLERMRLRGTYRYLPGQKVPVTMQRDGRNYEVVMALKEGYDQVEPLLNLFMTPDDEWIIWTPQGYYDASPGADRLIGWHINQGPARAAKFYLGEQFRKQLYRPDIIDRVFQTAELAVAVEQANQQLPRPAEPVDLRQVKQIEQIEPPQVRILGPADQSRSATPQVTIRAAVRSKNDLPVREVTFLLNGRPLFPKPELTPNGAAEQRIEQQVRLSRGRNEVTVLAANQASTSQPQKITLNYAPQEQQDVLKPSLYVLACGISTYQNPEHNLQFAHRDAHEFAAAIERQQGTLYGAVETKVLVNDEASRKNILDGMDWLVRSVTQHDVAMLFVSAHGFYDNRQNFYLATHEVDTESLRSTGIAFHEVNQLIQDLPCKVLLFVDSCHSGGVTGAKGTAGNPLRDLVTAEVGAIVFASSTPRELSLENAKWDNHGAFTKALLDTFASQDSDKDSPPDGLLTVTELEFNVARRVKELTAGQQHPVTQKPPTVRDFPVVRVGQ
jgi:WD40 repeat protein